MTEKLLPKLILLYIVSVTGLSNTICQIQTFLYFEKPECIYICVRSDSDSTNFIYTCIYFVFYNFVIFQFNFVGRILGPRGLTAKQLEQETGCKVMVRGKGSMRDKKKVSAPLALFSPPPLFQFNFVGRILGPRGMTTKQLETETGCRIMIRGRGSMRDRKKVGCKG